MQLARQHVPSPELATIFTVDGRPLHASDEYFLTSGEAIRCFFEKDAFDRTGQLCADARLCLNKLGHAMHDLDPAFDSLSRTPQLAALACDSGMQDPLLLQSMYIFKQPRIGGEVACLTFPDLISGAGHGARTRFMRSVAAPITCRTTGSRTPRCRCADSQATDHPCHSMLR